MFKAILNPLKSLRVSNGQLYKQAGNSVIVPVIKRIAERIAFAHSKSNGPSQLDRSGKFAVYTKMNGQFEGQSYVKDFVSLMRKQRIASYEDGLTDELFQIGKH